MDGDDWREYKEYREERKSRWHANHFVPFLKKVKSIAKRKNIEIKEFGNGHRRIVLDKNKYIDFWETGTVRTRPESNTELYDIIKILNNYEIR